MSFNHLFMYCVKAPRICRLESLQGVPKGEWKLHEGLPLQGAFPEANFSMNPEFPLDTLLADALGNISALLVLSERVTRTILEAAAPGSVEALPVAVKNHRGRAIAERYAILNPVGKHPVLDVDEAKVERDTFGNIQAYERFVLRTETDAYDYPPVFRASELPRYVLVEEPLANRILSLGTTGISFQPPAYFDGARLMPSLDSVQVK